MIGLALTIVGWAIFLTWGIRVATLPVTWKSHDRTWGRYAHTNDRRPRQSMASRKTRYVAS